MEEAEAFVLLRHLMFRRGLRKQYLPDMSALQVQVINMSIEYSIIPLITSHYRLFLATSYNAYFFL